VYTGINIPYNASPGDVGRSAGAFDIQRVTLHLRLRGSTLVTAATPFLVKWLAAGNERLGWQLTMAFWGVAASLLFLVTFFNTRERIAPPPAQKTNVRQDVQDLAHMAPGWSCSSWRRSS